MEMENYTKAFEKLYGTDSRVLKEQTKRYQRLNDEFLRLFDEQERFLFSTPGRTELSGNHTDHNHGRVLAASVNLDSIAVASKNNSQKIVLHSEGFFRPFEVDLKFLEVDEKEKETTTALIRGIAARFAELGYQTGGFSACMTSDVLPGSGLSSSFRWLQNIYTIKNVREQGVSLALALSEKYISEIGEGACRVHGGGFAGTIQVFLPVPNVSGFKRLMEPVFGKESIQELHIRQFGTILFKEIE